VDSRSGAASLSAHDRCGLAGESSEFHLSVRFIGDVSRESRLARAGITEQAKTCAAPSVPGPDLSQSATDFRASF
jgi:hypothetical protein